MIIHVIDNLEPGGAQAIVHEIVGGSEQSVVFSLCGLPQPPTNAWRSVYAYEVNLFGGWNILFALVRLLNLCIRRRRDALFVAHLDASTLIMCVLRPLLGLRLFVHVHANPAQWPKWYRICFRLVINSADLVIGGGEEHRRRLLEEGIAPSKIALVGVGSRFIDDGPRPFDHDIRKEFGIEPSSKILLNIARMVPGKGQAEILHALTRLRDRNVVAIIIGYGPEQNRLKELAYDLGVERQVFLPGQRTDLHNFYSAASVFLMPCLDESMGVVILEALAYKLPIVAYHSGCIGEFIQDGVNGILIPPNHERLAEIVSRMLEVPPKFDFSSNAQYSMRVMADRFWELCVRHGGGFAR